MKKIFIICAIFLFSLTCSMYAGNWIEQKVDASIAEYHDVCFIDNFTGFVLGDYSSAILKTTNSGETWVKQNMQFSGTLQNIKFFNTTEGIIVGDNGTIFRTSNTGESWAQVESGTLNTLYTIGIFGDNAWVLGNGVFLKSTNKGETWSIIKDVFMWAGGNFDCNNVFNEVIFLSDKIGYVSGMTVGNRDSHPKNYGTMIYQTNDGGAHFGIAMTFMPEGYFFKAYPKDEENILALVIDNVSFTSQSGDYSYLSPTRKVDCSVVCGTPDKNRGNNFAWVPCKTIDTLKTLCIDYNSSSKLSLIVGDNGTILRSSDGEKTWNIDTTNASIQFNSVAINGNNAWVVGSKQVGNNKCAATIYKYNNLENMPEIPVLINPQNQETGTPIEVKFSWLESLNATRYRLVISKFSNLTNPIFDEIVDNTFKEKVLENGTIYYWGVTAINGTNYSKLSTIWNFRTVIKTNVEDLTEGEFINIYPNPAKKDITITYNVVNVDIFDFDIYTIEGKVVFSAKVSSGDKIDLSIFASGRYCIVFKNKDYIYTKQIDILQ